MAEACSLCGTVLVPGEPVTGGMCPACTRRARVREHHRAALLGLAIGDALGASAEFKKPGEYPFTTARTGPLREIKGGGTFRVAPGQVTDDTQMACCLAETLRVHGQFVMADVAARYLEWSRHAFDIGAQTRRVISRLERGEEPLAASREVWRLSARPPAGNGSLMRAAPIAVFFKDAEARREAALADAAVTHWDARCRLAGVAFTTALGVCFEAVARGDPPSQAMAIGIAQEDVGRATQLLLARLPAEESAIRRAAEAIHLDLQMATVPDPMLYTDDLHFFRHSGFVRVSFRLAFWQLIHAPSLEEALIDVVNRGGDADTNAAITGALLGAFHGPGAIPPRWERTVLDALQSGPPSPLRDMYHPRALLKSLAV